MLMFDVQETIFNSANPGRVIQDFGQDKVIPKRLEPSSVLQIEDFRSGAKRVNVPKKHFSSLFLRDPQGKLRQSCRGDLQDYAGKCFLKTFLERQSKIAPRRTGALDDTFPLGRFHEQFPIGSWLGLSQSGRSEACKRQHNTELKNY